MKKTLLALICLLCCEAGFSQQWYPVYIDEDISYYVDLSSIEKNDDRIYCWQKVMYSGERRNQQATKFHEITKNGDWFNFSHTMNYVVYDRPGKRTQTLSTIFYANDGKSLHSSEDMEFSVKYTRLIPGSVGMAVFDEICRLYDLKPNNSANYYE